MLQTDMNSLDIPTNLAKNISFSDIGTDENEIQGVITITKASNENDVTHCVLYWGTNATTKYNTTPLATVVKTGSTLNATLSKNTLIPDGATH